MAGPRAPVADGRFDGALVECFVREKGEGESFFCFLGTPNSSDRSNRQQVNVFGYWRDLVPWQGDAFRALSFFYDPRRNTPCAVGPM